MNKIEVGPKWLKLGDLKVKVKAQWLDCNRNVGDAVIYDKKNDVVLIHPYAFDDDGVFMSDECSMWAAIHAAICYGGATEFRPGSRFELRNLADPKEGKKRSQSVEYLLIHRELRPEIREEYAKRRIRQYEALIKLGEEKVAEFFELSEVPRPEDLISSFEESIDTLKLWQHCYVTGKWCQLH